MRLSGREDSFAASRLPQGRFPRETRAGVSLSSFRRGRRCWWPSPLQTRRIAKEHIRAAQPRWHPIPASHESAPQPFDIACVKGNRVSVYFMNENGATLPFSFIPGLTSTSFNGVATRTINERTIPPMKRNPSPAWGGGDWLTPVSAAKTAKSLPEGCESRSETLCCGCPGDTWIRQCRRARGFGWGRPTYPFCDRSVVLVFSWFRFSYGKEKRTWQLRVISG